jgi:hypothetical protein
MIHIRFFHPVEELTGIRAETFYIPALAFGIECVHDEAGFPGAGKTGDHYQFVLRDGYTYIFKVIAAGTNDLDIPGFGGWWRGGCNRGLGFSRHDGLVWRSFCCFQSR